MSRDRVAYEAGRVSCLALIGRDDDVLAAKLLTSATERPDIVARAAVDVAGCGRTAESSERWRRPWTVPN